MNIHVHAFSMHQHDGVCVRVYLKYSIFVKSRYLKD